LRDKPKITKPIPELEKRNSHLLFQHLKNPTDILYHSQVHPKLSKSRSSPGKLTLTSLQTQPKAQNPRARSTSLTRQKSRMSTFISLDQPTMTQHEPTLLQPEINHYSPKHQSNKFNQSLHTTEPHTETNHNSQPITHSHTSKSLPSLLNPSSHTKSQHEPTKSESNSSKYKAQQNQITDIHRAMKDSFQRLEDKVNNLTKLQKESDLQMPHTTISQSSPINSQFKSPPKYPHPNIKSQSNRDLKNQMQMRLEQIATQSEPNSFYDSIEKISIQTSIQSINLKIQFILHLLHFSVCNYFL